jgi:serine/threonine protein kinase
MMTAAGKPKIGQGIFAVKNREPSRIISEQKKFMKNMILNLKKLDNY